MSLVALQVSGITHGSLCARSVACTPHAEMRDKDHEDDRNQRIRDNTMKIGGSLNGFVSNNIGEFFHSLLFHHVQHFSKT